MIDLHYWTTPNGHKMTMFLEEAGLPCRIIPVNLSAGDQFEPDFQAIAPSKRIPATVDHVPADGSTSVSLFESGAILLYLAVKIGRFVPPASDIRGRAEAPQWLLGQTATTIAQT
jgi:GST-like protein